MLIWAGGGVISSEASEALERLAEHLQAPVVTTSEGKGAISDRHPLSVGALRFRDDPLTAMAPEFDVVLAVCTRLANPEVLDGRQTVVQIDVDEEEIGRNYDNTFGIVGDARSSLELLQELLSAAGPPRPSRSEEVAAIRAARRAPHLRVEPQDSFTEAIRAAVPDDGVLVCDMTQVGYYSRVRYPVYKPRTFLTSSYFGNLGFAYPVALGAKVARPDAAVVVISGDGGFLFNSQELATAVKYGIGVVAVVFNDGAFGNVLRDQANQFDGRTIGAELHNPDFVRLAEAYGARGVRAKDPDDLGSAIEEALAAGAPTVIDVPVDAMPLPY